MVERTNNMAEMRPEEQSEKAELSAECMEQSTVERAVKTKIDAKSKLKGVGKLGWFTSKDINRHVPHLVRVSLWGLCIV